MLRRWQCSAATILWAAALVASATANDAAPRPPQVILLKLDDVIAGGRPGMSVPPRWQRVTDYLAGKKLKAAFGIIGWSLEKDDPAYFQWIKDLDRKGTVEFWLHGYLNRRTEDKTGEFETGTWQEQKAILEKCVRLAKEKLGIKLKAFGPHWSGTTDATDQALEAVPQITIWLYGPKKPKHFSRLSLERVLALENPTFVTDSAKFQSLYEKNAAAKEVLVLQGHPNQWDDQRWQGFVQIIEFLESKGCVFMTPSEYAKTLSK